MNIAQITDAKINRGRSFGRRYPSQPRRMKIIRWICVVVIPVTITIRIFKKKIESSLSGSLLNTESVSSPQ